MADTLRKTERLNGKILVEKMFAGGFKPFSIFPLHVVHMPVENQDAQAFVLLNTSERRLKRAVKRNRVKHQLRKAYRLHKHLLLQILTDRQQQSAIVFIYFSDELTSLAEIEKKMKTLLARVSEGLVRNVYFHIHYCFPYTSAGLVFRL